mmetsp:Transcript_54666/g.142760  ORF Transcript_54666/g.142760 Transcript_54666/m.142760 type:complete len:475 (-) Transcript_54666:92-1516(-)|eukprot:CAMPEP_0115389356 /NCGR_PEP_ID=MMETSP0271-20121206/9646_1 /TAXON_ID=71861 /ORGANISM="Scrippsiella trochoidea, Strain CCMP3099" /LENGTH=474 /DNA_ID=CAMNT_0002812869 /DNA_START=181 /DNA_END=1605 /DNA_ORIENTATION=-
MSLGTEHRGNDAPQPALGGCSGVHDVTRYDGMQVDVYSQSHDRWLAGRVARVLDSGLITVAFGLAGSLHRKTLPPCSAHIRFAPEREGGTSGKHAAPGPLGQVAWHLQDANAPCIRRAAVDRVMCALAGTFQDGEDASVETAQETEASAAVGDLSCAIANGDMLVTEAVARHLDDSDKDVRMLTLLALRPAVERGNKQIVQIVKAALHDTHNTVRVAAVSALRPLVAKGDRHAVEETIVCSRDCADTVRWSCLQSLQQMLMNDCHDDVVDAVLQRIVDSQPDVSKAAADALQFCTRAGNRQVIDALGELLQHELLHVRQAAGHALQPAMEQGNSHAIEAAVRCHDSSSVTVRTAMIHALEPAASAGAETAIAALVSCIEDEYRTVRSCAEAALRPAVGGMHCCALEKLACLCKEHPDPRVRISALRALKPAAAKCDADLLSHMKDCLRDADADVRTAAAFALDDEGDRSESNGS